MVSNDQERQVTLERVKQFQLQVDGAHENQTTCAHLK